jgi:hypothetical protein
MNTDTLLGFLLWAGSSAGLMAISSFLLERFPPFQKIASKTRLYIVVGVVILIPQVVNLLPLVPQSTWDTLQPIWEGLVTSVVVAITFVTSEFTHNTDKRLTK